jgi:NAD(P)-dependent dehydrogenase (short-subunit alcohol dehydrogenase family)
MQLNGRTILITGGASGLGSATVDMVVAQGGRVVVIDLNEEAGRAKEATHRGAVRFVKGDVTAEADAQRAIDVALAELGGVHGLVNVAGIPAAERVLPKEGVQPLPHFERVIRVNLIGTFNVIRLAAAAMASNAPAAGGERGVIVNTASVAAFDGQIGQAAYAASKGGIVAMTLPIARELAQFGIRVLTIAPGLFLTPLLANLPQEAQDSLAAAIPFPRRLGQADEFASLALHMIDNPYLNGEVVRLDAALRMAPR